MVRGRSKEYRLVALRKRHKERRDEKEVDSQTLSPFQKCIPWKHESEKKKCEDKRALCNEDQACAHHVGTPLCQEDGFICTSSILSTIPQSIQQTVGATKRTICNSQLRPSDIYLKQRSQTQRRASNPVPVCGLDVHAPRRN